MSLFSVVVVPQVPLVHADPILAQNQFSNVNSQTGINPQCGGNPPGSLCPGPSGATEGTCFQPTLTGVIGSASLMLEMQQAINGIPRRGQPVISGRIYIMAPDPTTLYATTCRASNPFSTAGVLLATSDFLSFCSSQAGCFCNTCVGLGPNLQVVTWAFTGANQIIVAAGQTYVLLLWLECNNSISCVYDDNNSMSEGTSSNPFGGGAVLCRVCMVVDPFNTGPFARSTHDDTIVQGQALAVPFILFGTSGGTVTPGPTSCGGGNCGTVTSTSSTTTVNFNQTITLFYIGTSPFDGFVVNVTTYLGATYIGTLFLAVYVVNQGCVTANGPFSVQCPGIKLASTSFTNPAGPAKIVYATAVQVISGQTFGVALSGSVNGLRINDTNTGSVMYQTTGTIPTVISQFQTFSGSSKVALFAGLFKGSSPPSNGQVTGNNSVGDLLLGFVDWLGMGRLAGGLTALLFIFSGAIVGIGLATRHLTEAPGGRRRPGFPPVGFLLIFLFLVFIFSAPIASGGVSILPAWVTIFVMAVFTWLFTEGILRRGGRF